jgi:ribosomal protein L37AE/L43A
MDITAISAALTSIKTAADLAKLIKDTDSSLERAESKLKLAELMSALADAKLEVVEIQQLVSEKDARIRSLEEQVALKERLQWESPYYWLVNGSSKEGPFCQQCFDTDGKQVRLQGNGSGWWKCAACKNTYTDKDYKEPEMPRSQSVRTSFTW